MAIEQKHLDRAIALAKTYGATRLILFGSALRHPDQARDLDLACDGVAGWKLYELGARLEEELQVPLDLVPLTPPSRLTRLIERRGKGLLGPRPDSVRTSASSWRPWKQSCRSCWRFRLTSPIASPPSASKRP